MASLRIRRAVRPSCGLAPAVCPRVLGSDRGSQGTARRRPVPDQHHCSGNCGTRERHFCARTAANGQETRSLPRDCANRPRTVARRGRIGAPTWKTQPRRSADHREGHAYPAEGPVAGMVERTPLGRLICRSPASRVTVIIATVRTSSSASCRCQRSWHAKNRCTSDQ